MNNLTFREYLIGCCINGLFACEAEEWHYTDPARRAEKAIEQADEIIKQLEKAA